MGCICIGNDTKYVNENDYIEKYSKYLTMENEYNSLMTKTEEETSFVRNKRQNLLKEQLNKHMSTEMTNESFLEFFNEFRTYPVYYMSKIKSQILVKLNNENMILENGYSFIKNYEQIIHDFHKLEQILSEDGYHPIDWSSRLLNNRNNEDKLYIYFKECLRLEIKGKFDQKTTISLSLLDNKIEAVESLFTKPFNSAAFYYCEQNNTSNFIFGIKRTKTSKQKLVNFNINQLSLDHPLFENLAYRQKIIKGEYYLDEDKNKLKAIFTLIDKSVIIEYFNIKY